MELYELRKQKKLTQKEVADLVGIPYRTYIRYEKNESYKDSYKYAKIVEDLKRIFLIDENHGILSLDMIRDAITPVLEKNGINKCYLFGSYARNEATEMSDVDLLVDTNITGLNFFELVENLRMALNKKVDLLRICDLKPDNPIILEILKEGIKII